MKWYFIIILILAIIIFLCFLVGYLIWKMAIPTPPKDKYKVETAKTPVEVEFREYLKREEKRLNSMNLEEITIRSFDGLNLHAYFREAQSKTTKTIISVHGYHGSALSTAPAFSHWLSDFNYNILFIDLRSYGKSEGKYTTYGVLDHKDLLSWITYLTERFNQEIEIALIGISMGASTVMATANKIPQEVKCMICDCGYTSPYDEFNYLLTTKYHLPFPKFFLFFAETINKLVCHFGFKDINTKEILKGARVPVLFIHGGADNFVPTKMTEQNYRACTNSKEIKIFDGVPHARSFFENKEEYQKMVLDFLAKNF